MIKKLESKEASKKRERRNQYILGGVLIIVLFGSVFGMVVGSFGSNSGNSSKKELNYRGYSFQIENGRYILQIGNSNFSFSENPKKVESLNKEVNLTSTLKKYSGMPLYISSIDYPSFNEIYSNLQNYALRIQGACINGEVCLDKTLPIKTCEDNLIIIKESPTNKIYEKKNCVYIEGKKEDLLKLTDEFLLREIGIK